MDGACTLERVAWARNRFVATLAAAGLAVGALTTAGAAPASSEVRATAATAGLATTVRAAGGGRPNIVLITTDDQRVDEMAWMPRTRRLIGDGGATFMNAISPHPLCCPARAEILTGQYAHNSGVRHNKGPWGGFPAFSRAHRRDHLGTWLTRAGYNTAFVGKFLNGYTARHGDQPGWSSWSPTLAGTYRYTQFAMRVDGRTKKFNLARDRRHYIADVVGDRGAALVRRYARSPKPFFLWVSHVGPHTANVDGQWVPPIPAPRHRGLFAGSRPPVLTQPNYGEADSSDKPRSAQGHPEPTADFVRSHLQRIRSLQAVDEANARLLRTLSDTGELRNTIIVFTSDNGYLQGEHGLSGKNWPYENSLRVPMLVRGPGVPAGVRREQNATLVDLPATFLQAAGAPRGSTDGTNLLPALTQDQATAETSLIQAGASNAPWSWRGVRTARYTYVAWQDGAEELYDRRTDPFQLENVLRADQDPAVLDRYAAVVAEMRRRLAQLAVCAGATCRPDLPAVPEPAADPAPEADPAPDADPAPETEADPAT